MLATGARIGEILALRWEDLDLAAERPTLTILEQLGADHDGPDDGHRRSKRVA